LALLIESRASQIRQEEIPLGDSGFLKPIVSFVDAPSKRIGGITPAQEVSRRAVRHDIDKDDRRQAADDQSLRQAAFLNPLLHVVLT